MQGKKQRVAVGLSGGLDSAVAALLLKEQGYDVFGVTMCIHKTTSGVNLVVSAQEVAERIGITLEAVDCCNTFEEEVLFPSWCEFQTGATPNPCVRCNAMLKFGILYAFAMRKGAERFATGHYARLEYDKTGHPLMYRGRDLSKDQSYFLYAVESEVLKNTLFPLGELSKAEVRALGTVWNLGISRSRESQDHCMADRESHLAEQLRVHFKGSVKPGVFQDEFGKVLARHPGTHLFTIGQRRGLGFAAGKRMKVISINHESGVIVVSDKPDAACSLVCTAGHFKWQQEPLSVGARIMAQVRYQQAPVSAVVTELKLDEQIITLRFESAVFGVTPGQSLVLYDDDLLLGGGIILRNPS